jgi:hypothetical protein
MNPQHANWLQSILTMKNRFILLLSFMILVACSERRKESHLKTLAVPSQIVSGQPHLFTDASGKVYLSWIEVVDGSNQLRFSTLTNSTTWSEPITIVAGKNWFVNWADYPMMAAQGEELIAHFLGKSGEGKFAYDVMTTFSHDAGKNWTEPQSIHDDGLQAEHGFVSLLPYDNNFLITWLDGRNTVAMEGMNDHEGHHGQMSVRAALVDVNGNKLNEWELDNRTCDCCQTTSAITLNGPVVIYRDRSDDEIRDMYITRFANEKWSEPKPVYSDNWKIAGCPVNGPRADAIENNLAIVWYTAPEGKAEVKVIFSADGGESFDVPIRVDEGNTIGRVDLVMLDASTAMVSYMEGAEIRAVKIKRDGTKSESITIASTSESRSSGFPQMTRAGNLLIFAWTDDQEKVIRSAVLELYW